MRVSCCDEGDCIACKKNRVDLCKEMARLGIVEAELAVLVRSRASDPPILCQEESNVFAARHHPCWDVVE